MPMCRYSGFAFLGGLALLLTATASAQTVVPRPTAQIGTRDGVPPPRTGTGSVKGRVLDGATGAAIPRAHVVIQSGTRASALTDASGAFAFANLPPGPFTISVDKSTYLGTLYPTPGRTIRSRMRPAVLADGQGLEGIIIPMFHGGSISGHVLDANGDPVDYAQVSVLSVPAAGRAGKPLLRGTVPTDDRGEFRMGRLQSGTFIVQVTARRLPNGDDMIAGAGATPPSPQPLPTYYPGALSLDQAQPIVLERGQTATDIDVVLAEGTPGIVTAIVTMSDGTPITGSRAYMNARRLAAEDGVQTSGFSTGAGMQPDGSFRFVLPPGEYSLDARVSPQTMNAVAPRPEDEQFGFVKISVASGAEEAVALTVGRGATASGRVVFEGTRPPPPSPGKARIPLFSENGECRSGEATIGADWTFKIEGLSGTCSTPPMGMFGAWTLKAVIINGENAADAPVTFQPNQQFRNVQVIVTDKRTEVVFHVSDETGQPTRDYVAIVYPVQKSRWSTGSRTYVGPRVDLALLTQARTGSVLTPGASTTTASAAPRREMLSGLRPGEYYIVAVDDLEQEESRDPIVLDKLRSSAVRTTLSEGVPIDLPLRRINFADAMSKR
jgi:hypothetical protein